MQTDFLITAGERPKRLDVFLVNREPRLSRAALQRLIMQGRVRLNGRPVKPSQKVKPGDQIAFDKPPAAPLTRCGEAVSLDIVFEDEHLLVLNKPAGIIVHPAPGHWTDTLVNALLHHLHSSATEVPLRGEAARPGLVHRLDKDTSGVMVIAKTTEAHRGLARQFERHAITRVYEAVVSGVPEDRVGLINLAIGRDRKRRKMVSSHTALPKASATEYRVRQAYGTVAAHLVLYPKSGRTHQLRVHLQSMGHSILGDPTYRDHVPSPGLPVRIPRLMLHASTLGFCHPVARIPQLYAASLPAEMIQVLQKLEGLASSIATSES